MTCNPFLNRVPGVRRRCQADLLWAFQSLRSLVHAQVGDARGVQLACN
jgi:hypothetical protein